MTCFAGASGVTVRTGWGEPADPDADASAPDGNAVAVVAEVAEVAEVAVTAGDSGD